MRRYSTIALCAAIFCLSLWGLYRAYELGFINLPGISSTCQSGYCKPRPHAADHLCNEGWHCGPYEGK